MNRYLFATLAVLAAAAVCAAEAPQDPWLRTQAHLDREALARGGDFRIALVLDIDKGFHVNANPPALDFQIPTVLAPEPAAAVRWGKVTYPKGEPFAADWADGKAITVYGGGSILVVHGTVADDAPLGPVTLRLTLGYQGCDAKTCYQPGEQTVEVAANIVEAGTAAAPANAALFAAAEKAGAPASPDAAPEIRFEGEVDIGEWFQEGFLYGLALLFVGGLALNLTPCVFPLIPVTMNFFAAQGESRPAKVLPLAVLYVLGLAVTFSVVGVLAALAGKSLGVALQSPWGVLGVVTVLAVMMAGSFGAFEIQLPSSTMGKLSGRRGILGAAFMGMVMGAIAAPCVGPFLISLITSIAKLATSHTLSKALVFGAGAFFTVGLGLGLPYVFLGAFTSLINRFPRGGGWLIWTKRLLGMGLAGLILYFLQPFISPGLFWPLVLGLFIFAAVFLGLLEGRSRRPFSTPFRAARIVAAVALLVAGFYVYAEYAPAAEDAMAKPVAGGGGPHIEWSPWQDGLLETATAAREPVLLYFGADWCAECRAWKTQVFSDPRVIKASEGLTRIFVDVTRAPEGAKHRFSDAYRGTNPPAVILFGRDAKVVKAYRDPPGAEEFAEAVRQAAGADARRQTRGASRR